MTKRQYPEYKLFGDLDGMTVGELKELLNTYDDMDRIRARTREEYGAFGGPSVEHEYFTIGN